MVGIGTGRAFVHEHDGGGALGPPQGRASPADLPVLPGKRGNGGVMGGIEHSPLDDAGSQIATTAGAVEVIDRGSVVLDESGRSVRAITWAIKDVGRVIVRNEGIDGTGATKEINEPSPERTDRKQGFQFSEPIDKYQFRSNTLSRSVSSPGTSG